MNTSDQEAGKESKYIYEEILKKQYVISAIRNLFVKTNQNKKVAMRVVVFIAKQPPEMLMN